MTPKFRNSPELPLCHIRAITISKDLRVRRSHSQKRRKVQPSRHIIENEYCTIEPNVHQNLKNMRTRLRGYFCKPCKAVRNHSFLFTSLVCYMKNLLIALCTTFVTAGLLLLETSTNSGHHDHYPRFLSRQVLDDELRSSLFPVGHIDLVGFIAIIIALMLAASGGIGGGGLLVPIFVLILRFPVKQAVGLSNVAVFGGAMANTAVNSSKRHPMANRPLIDWDVLSMMEPLTMAGALVGAELNQVLPEVLVVVMLVLLLGFTTARTLQKVRNQRPRRVVCSLLMCCS